MTSSFFNSNLNEYFTSSNLLIKKDYSLTTKKNRNYLRLKRKRSPINLKDNDKCIISFERTKKKEKCNKLIKEKKTEDFNTIKFQDLSKNVLSIITSYLRIDDLLKLKNIGSHKIRLYIIELFELMKNNHNYFLLKEVKSNKVLFLNKYDSLLNKNYFIKNSFLNELNFKKKYEIKYILYHAKNNKIYYLIHCLLYTFFCYSEVDGKDIDWLEGSMIRLPENDYYEKFQFVEEFNSNEVSIFSLNKILLYNIYTKNKDYLIYLNYLCDFVFYKKELKLLIVPNLSGNKIEFYKISSIKNIKFPLGKLDINSNENEEGKIVEYKDGCDILNLGDYNNGKEFVNLICVYNLRSKKIIIFDCKKMKNIKIICTNSNIIKVNINELYLIVYSENKSLNYYSLSLRQNNEFSFLNTFSLNNICTNLDNIIHLSLINNSNLINNTYLLLMNFPEKNIIKPFVLYLEKLNYKNDFYYSFAPLGNNINENIAISDEELIIYIDLINEKKKDNINLDNYGNILNLKMLICHGKESLDEKKKNKFGKNYSLKEFSSILL
jgi:hypothetical protein